MTDKHWNDLGELGRQMSSLSNLLNRAQQYGDAREEQRINTQIAHVQHLRDKILVKIAEFSAAA